MCDPLNSGVGLFTCSTYVPHYYVIINSKVTYSGLEHCMGTHILTGHMQIARGKKAGRVMTSNELLRQIHFNE
jgi:hypothetical protein